MTLKRHKWSTKGAMMAQKQPAWPASHYRPYVKEWSTANRRRTAGCPSIDDDTAAYTSQGGRVEKHEAGGPMNGQELRRAIDVFWDERSRGIYFPPAYEDRLSVDDAYRIQRADDRVGSDRQLATSGTLNGPSSRIRDPVPS